MGHLSVIFPLKSPLIGGFFQQAMFDYRRVIIIHLPQWDCDLNESSMKRRHLETAPEDDCWWNTFQAWQKVSCNIFQYLYCIYIYMLYMYILNIIYRVSKLLITYERLPVKSLLVFCQRCQVSCQNLQGGLWDLTGGAAERRSGRGWRRDFHDKPSGKP